MRKIFKFRMVITNCIYCWFLFIAGEKFLCLHQTNIAIYLQFFRRYFLIDNKNLPLQIKISLMNSYISQPLSRFFYIIQFYTYFFLLNLTQCNAQESLKVEITVKTAMMNKMSDCNQRVCCSNISIRRIDKDWLMMNGSQFHKMEVAGKKRCLSESFMFNT